MTEIGLLGMGTVGSGVYEIINLRHSGLLENAPLHIKRILVRDRFKDRKVALEEGLLTEDIEEILADPEISIVVCVMGGLEPEYTYIRRALESGKHVVTANKEVMALHIRELLDIARQNGVRILFEASVGGGIPIIDSVAELLKINRISSVMGILNGTTNYILTKLTKEKRDFPDVLKEAQQLGFAEADPSADIDGFDVMRKISILASICFHTVVDEKDVHQRGIGNITLNDILMADYFGYAIKYIGKATLKDSQYSISVTPVLISKDSVIANVNAEYNVIIVEGDIIGQLCFIGKGAGKDATANSVVSDILKITSGKITNDQITFQGNVSSNGTMGILNEYYIRVSFKTYDSFSQALDLISQHIRKDRMIYQDGMLFIITERILSNEMQSLSHQLKEVADDVFYARLDSSLL